MNKEQKDDFLAFISKFYAYDTIVSVQSHEVVAIKIYEEIKKFNKNKLSEYIEGNFLDVQIHIPQEIWTGQEWYLVGSHPFNPDIEFITIFIK